MLHIQARFERILLATIWRPNLQNTGTIYKKIDKANFEKPSKITMSLTLAKSRNRKPL